VILSLRGESVETTLALHRTICHELPWFAHPNQNSKIEVQVSNLVAKEEIAAPLRGSQ
jgi:hypothetical protein